MKFEWDPRKSSANQRGGLVKMKRKSTTKKFKSVAAMDRCLETHDLGVIFARQGKVVRPRVKKINLDLPETVINSIDRVANSIGIARQPLIKLWIHEKLREELAAS